MPSTHDQVFNLEDELNALSSPTSLEVLSHSQDYDADIVAAIAAQLAINGTGGGGGPVAAHDVSVTPAGNISSTDVQAALEELDGQIVSAVSDLVASAPGALNTLDELAAALGDDANFATTVTNALAAKQPLDSDLTAIAALSTTAFGRGLLELANAAALLAAAGGASSARTVTAGAGLTGGGDLSADRTIDANVDGSTLEINSDTIRVKAAGILASHIGDAELAALAGLTSAADKGIQFTGSGTAGTYDLTTAGKALLDDADAAAQRSTLGLGGLATLSAISSSEITDGSIVNADVSGSAAIAYSKLNLAASIVAGDFSDAEIAALAGLTSAADRLPYFTGSGTAGLATFTSAGRALVDDADAAAQLTTLGVSSFIQTLVDDTSAATARTTLGIAGAVGGVEWTSVVKQSDESVTSSTALQDDNELLFTTASGGIYEWKLLLLYVSTAGAGTPDLKTAFGETVVTSADRGGYRAVGIATGETLNRTGAIADASQTLAWGTSAQIRGVHAEGITLGGGGNFRVQWAQNTSDSNATTVKAGSVLAYRRLI